MSTHRPLTHVASRVVSVLISAGAGSTRSSDARRQNRSTLCQAQGKSKSDPLLASSDSDVMVLALRIFVSFFTAFLFLLFVFNSIQQYYVKGTQRKYRVAQANRRRASMRAITRDISRINESFEAPE